MVKKTKNYKKNYKKPNKQQKTKYNNKCCSLHPCVLLNSIFFCVLPDKDE